MAETILTKLKKPETVQPSKPKFMLSGESGVGKTFFALSFRKPVFVDIEKGGTRPQYQQKLKDVEGMYFGADEGANDFGEVISLVKTLAIEKHEFQTLILDSVTHLYLTEASKAEALVGNDFGRDKKEANKPVRQLLRWIDKLDMTVILISHSKNKWGRKGKEIFQDGTTFDFYDKTEYLLDIWIEIITGGKNFIVRKSRIQTLPQGEMFPLSYDRFSELYGKEIIEKPSVPIELATNKQVAELKSLTKTLNISDIEINKLQRKFDVTKWEELTSGQVMKGIEFYQKKIINLVNRDEEEKIKDNCCDATEVNIY